MATDETSPQSNSLFHFGLLTGYLKEVVSHITLIALGDGERTLVVAAQRASHGHFFVWVLVVRAPAFETLPVEGVAAEDGHVEVFFLMVPGLFHSLLGAQLTHLTLAAAFGLFYLLRIEDVL